MIKQLAGSAALILALALSIDAAIARWYPASTTSGTEATIIASLLAFAAASLGISAYERIKTKDT
jgi:hypothetical protein